MATLQKFKLLATQCTVARTPSRSPTSSPVIHLRRRKTLKMLLSRGGDGGVRKFHDQESHQCNDAQKKSNNNKEQQLVVVSNKLKDLFISSPPPFEGRRGEEEGGGRGGDVAVGLRRGGGGGGRMLRPLNATLRQRLLRRVWRPVLVAIPED